MFDVTIYVLCFQVLLSLWAEILTISLRRLLYYLLTYLLITMSLPEEFTGVRKLKIRLDFNIWQKLEKLFKSIVFDLGKTELPVFRNDVQEFEISAGTYLVELNGWSTRSFAGFCVLNSLLNSFLQEKLTKKSQAILPKAKQ